MLAQIPREKQNFEVSGFLFLADDTKLVVVQFKPQDMSQNQFYYSSNDPQVAHI